MKIILLDLPSEVLLYHYNLGNYTYSKKRQQSKTFTRNNADALNAFEKRVNERHQR